MEDTKQPVHIANLFTGFKFEVKKTRRTKRGDLLDAFIERLEPEYSNFTGKKLTYAMLARIFAIKRMDCEDMYCLYQECNKANHFGKLFWYKIKTIESKPFKRQVIPSA